jgi:alpha-tubulin suppressor-like RCC1 family protein
MWNSDKLVLGSAGNTATAIAAGMQHTCALRNDGAVVCWGYNAQGALGTGNVAIVGNTVGTMGSHLKEVDIGAGIFTCVL